MKNYKFSINTLYIIYLLKICYIILFVILYYNNYITNDRLFSFLLILIVILVYTRVIRYIKNNDNLNYINNKNIEKGLIISKYKNIFLYLLAIIEIKLYNIFSRLNSIFYSKQYIVFILYEIIMQILIKPLKLLYYFYYKVIIRGSSISILELLFRRIEGLIFSILIFSNLYSFILNQIKGTELFCVYLILIILNLIIEYNYGEIKLGKIKLCINHDYNSLLIYRYQVSIINIFILKCVEKDGIKVNKRFNNLIHYWFIEDNYINSIEYFKFEVVHNWKLMKLEFINKPSIVLYNGLYKLYNSNLFFSNLLDNKYYIEKHKDQKILELIRSLYECDELKVKLLIYLLGDIEDYYGIIGIDHYKSVLNMDLACLHITNFFNDYKNLANIKVNHKKDFNFSYDLELNHVFFNKLYLILTNNKLYQQNMNLIEDSLNKGFDRMLDCYDGVDSEGDMLIGILEFINNLRTEGMFLSINHKKILYFNLIQLLYEKNNLSEHLFNAPGIKTYVEYKKFKNQFKVNSEILELINKLDAEHALVELKKSRIRKFLEYLFYSL